MFKKLDRNMKDIERFQIKLLEINTTTYEMKNMLDGINGRLDIAEEKISEPEPQKQKLSKIKERKEN